MANIFISYNHENITAVNTIVDDIEALGHTAWFDHELSGGQSWWDKILATVRDCDVFIFLMDQKSLDSTACQREYGYAEDLGKSILPILIADDISTNLLPPALSKIQFLDYRKQDRMTALSLARAISSIPPPKKLPNPLPTPPEAPISYLGNLTEQIESTSNLSYEEQSTLAVDLKRCFRVPETTADATTLLKKLRKRRDLFATIAEEIDELLAITQKPSSAPPFSEADNSQDEYDESTKESINNKKATGKKKKEPLTPSYYKAFGLQLLFGFGLFHADNTLKRKWLYLLITFYTLLDLLYLTQISGRSDFLAGTFWIGLTLYILSFIDVGVTCALRRKEQRH